MIEKKLDCNRPIYFHGCMKHNQISLQSVTVEEIPSECKCSTMNHYSLHTVLMANHSFKEMISTI